MVRDARNLHSYVKAMGEASPTWTIECLAALVELC